MYQTRRFSNLRHHLHSEIGKHFSPRHRETENHDTTSSNHETMNVRWIQCFPHTYYKPWLVYGGFEVQARDSNRYWSHKELEMYTIFTHFSKKRWVLLYYRGQKLGSRVNFLDVLKYPKYENRIFRVSCTYVQIFWLELVSQFSTVSAEIWI